ncbi:MAG: SBBP repeat-containing protein [Pirellulales bacterium]
MHQSTYPSFLVLVTALFLISLAFGRGQAQSIEWTRQLGTSVDERSFGVSADGLGNVYISGYTAGSLGGPFAGGITDAFVSKCDATGTLLWSRQLGTSSLYDISYAVSADGLGNVYISGRTDGNLGGTNAGSSDAFVSKYDAAGTLQWTQQFGTNNADESYGVSADGLGSVYISGFTGPHSGALDVFVRKYGAAGTLQWSRQFGTSADEGGSGVSADGLGNVYITGSTRGSLGGANAGSYDAFISKYDAAGTLQWTRQLGTSADDYSSGVSADGLGNVYITGSTAGSLSGTNAGGDDAFISKYDAVGTLQWTRQLGTTDRDVSFGVSADGLGNAYISGLTRGSLGGPNAGGSDAFVSKYDAAGTLQWSQQLGTSTSDWSEGVSADGLGSVYISGTTQGSLGGPTAGLEDAFVAKYSDSLPGDYNTSGFADAADYVVWRDNVGSSVSLPNDSTAGVGQDDYDRWRNHFGQTAGSGSRTSANAAVPEQATWLLLLAAVPMMWSCRRATAS